MEKRIIDEALDEAKAIRLYVNPMNLSELFSNQVKPLSKRRCLHSHVFRGAGSNTMRSFMERECIIVIRNPILVVSDAIYVTDYKLVKNTEWRWMSTTGYFLRLYEYLTPLEYYMIEIPKKTEEILNYIKNIKDDLIL